MQTLLQAVFDWRSARTRTDRERLSLSPATSFVSVLSRSPLAIENGSWLAQARHRAAHSPRRDAITNTNRGPMKSFYVTVAFAVALVSLSSQSEAAIQLVPVVTSGITSPTFVTRAGDGSNRLFILEQAGRIGVLTPGTAARTLFHDDRTNGTYG